MPLYDFNCEQCGNIELIIPVSEINTPQMCPNCQTLMKKMLSVPSIVFKGSGFYCNDSKGPSISSATNNNVVSSSSASSTASSSSDGKFKVKRS